MKLGFENPKSAKVEHPSEVNGDAESVEFPGKVIGDADQEVPIVGDRELGGPAEKGSNSLGNLSS